MQTIKLFSRLLVYLTLTERWGLLHCSESNLIGLGVRYINAVSNSHSFGQGWGAYIIYRSPKGVIEQPDYRIYKNGGSI